MLAVYRRHFNEQGPLARFLSDNAFGVYLIHPPVLIACAIALHPLAWPAIAKAALLTVLAGDRQLRGLRVHREEIAAARDRVTARERVQISVYCVRSRFLSNGSAWPAI